MSSRHLSRTTLAKPISTDWVAELSDRSFWLIRPEERKMCQRWEPGDLIIIRFGMIGQNGTATSYWLEQMRGYDSRLNNAFKDVWVWAHYLGDSRPVILPDPLNPAAPPPTVPEFNPFNSLVEGWYLDKSREEEEARWAEIDRMKLGPGIHFLDDGMRMVIIPEPKRTRKRKPAAGKKPRSHRSARPA